MCFLCSSTKQGMLAKASPMQQAISKVKAILSEAAEHISQIAGPQQVIAVNGGDAVIIHSFAGFMEC